MKPEEVWLLFHTGRRAARDKTLRTHVVLPKVALALSVGLHHHVGGFGLADGHQAGGHSGQRLNDKWKHHQTSQLMTHVHFTVMHESSVLLW